jgi:hypothetical protein
MPTTLAHEAMTDAAWRTAGVYPIPGDWPAISLRQPVELTVELPERGLRLIFQREGDEPAWFFPTLNALAKVLALPSNWDSYGGRSTDFRAFSGALHTLDRVMGKDTTVPTVVPTAEGGIQLEWHTRGIDLEIEIPPTGPPYVSCQNRQDNTEWEGGLSTNLEQLRGVVSGLSLHR